MRGLRWMLRGSGVAIPTNSGMDSGVSLSAGCGQRSEAPYPAGQLTGPCGPNWKGWCEVEEWNHAPVANPLDRDWTGRLWAFTFGAIGSVRVFVWERNLDDALEVAMDWCADNAPGLFVSLDLADAAAELGLDSNTEDHDEAERIYEYATRDLTVVSHTTYGNGLDAIPSWEWWVDEVVDPVLYYAIAHRSYDEAHMEAEV